MALARRWVSGLLTLLAVAAAAAEGNAEPLIRLPTQNQDEAAPAPAPTSAEERLARWAALVPGYSGYEKYRHQVICDVCPEKFPNYKAKIKNFFEEHLNTDEEIRYCLQGSGYFDARDENEQWIRVRVAVKKGGVIVLPAGMYHCFTLDSENRNETYKNPRPGVIINRPVPRRILQDICDVCRPEKFPNYKAKIKNFFEEHLNTDEEIRYCLQGSGYFDARDESEQWIRVRVAVKKGGVIVLPAGMYHCFTLDSENKDETSENPRPGVIINRPVPRRILQTLKRRGHLLAKNSLNPEPGVIIAAEGNPETMILLPTQIEHQAAPAPAPSAEERVTAASGYDNYGHQLPRRRILQAMAPSDANLRAGDDSGKKKDLALAGYLAIGGAAIIAGLAVIYLGYRFYRQEVELRQWKVPFALYPPNGTSHPGGCRVCLGSFWWGARVAVLPACGHVFHRRCLRGVIRVSPRCPLCRAALG